MIKGAGRSRLRPVFPLLLISLLIPCALLWGRMANRTSTMLIPVGPTPATPMWSAFLECFDPGAVVGTPCGVCSDASSRSKRRSLFAKTRQSALCADNRVAVLPVLTPKLCGSPFPPPLTSASLSDIPCVIAYTYLATSRSYLGMNTRVRLCALRMRAPVGGLYYLLSLFIYYY